MIKQILKDDLIIAMRENFTSMKSVIRQINVRINAFEKINGTDITDAEILSLIDKELKEIKATGEYAIGDAAVEVFEQKDYLASFDEFRPRQLRIDEITGVIKDILYKYSIDKSMKNMGLIMKKFKETYANQDNKIVSTVVKEILSK